MYGGIITRVNLYTSVFNTFFKEKPSGTFNETVLGSAPSKESPLGHAILVVGYDNSKMEWTVLNSCEYTVRTGSCCVACFQAV
jgi:C1A family cysteine protease